MRLPDSEMLLALATFQKVAAHALEQLMPGDEHDFVVLVFPREGDADGTRTINVLTTVSPDEVRAVLAAASSRLPVPQEH